MNTEYLALTWTTSRGRETYGYNIATLRTQDNPVRKFRCMGGGYDMIGTVFGEWLAATYPDRLLAIADKAGATRHATGERSENRAGLYGMTYHEGENQHVTLDGACGIESMRRIAEAIGLEVRSTWKGRGETTGFMVTDTRDLH